jgi:hypothetical protein
MSDMNANPAAGSDSGPVSDPVAMIEGLLEREDDAPTGRPRDQKPDPEPAPEPEEAPEHEPEPETPDDEPGEDEDGGDAEEPEQTEPTTELYTVKIDGKEQQVTRDELLSGYQRQADYSRKTAELAEQRRAAEAEFSRVAAERQHYAQQLEQVATVLQATLPPRPTQEQLDADPIGYMQAKEAWESRVGQLQQVLAERDGALRAQQEQAQAQQQQMLAQARERLLEMVPEWQKPEVAQREKPAIANHLRAIGYSDAEIGQAADPRALLMARESMLYRQLVATKPQVQQRVANAPKMVRPGASGPAPDQTKSIVQKLKRGGGKDLDLAARLIEMG